MSNQSSSTPSSTPAAETSSLLVTPATVDFGNVAVGSTVMRTLTFSIQGNSSLQISTIQINGDAFSTTGSLDGMTITPGKSYPLQMEFSPHTTTLITGSIFITVNGYATPIGIALSGTGQSIPISTSQGALNFGDVYDQDKKVLPFDVTNFSNNVVSLALGFTGATNFSTDAPSPLTLSPQQTTTINITDTASAGPTSGVFSMTVTDPVTGIQTTAGIPLGQTGLHYVILTWNASPTPGVVYNVYRDDVSGTLNPGGPATDLVPINIVAITGLSYIDNQVVPGTTVHYTVTALDAGGESDQSNEAPAVIPNP